VGIPDSRLVHLVRSALVHLYDHAYLQNHPLVEMLDLDGADRVTRVQGVRRALLECIEVLKPEGREQEKGEAARAYAILTYRYVDGLSIEEIADKLALSRRQVYREHGKGLKAVASLLQDRVRKSVSTVAQREDRLGAIRAEVAHLQQAVQPEFLNLSRILDEVFRLLGPLMRQAGVQVRMAAPETWPSIVADRVILRQTLMNLLSYVLHVARTDLEIGVRYEVKELCIEVYEAVPGRTETMASAQPSPLKPDEVSLLVAQALAEVQGGHLEVEYGEHNILRAYLVLPTSERKTLLVIDDNADIIALFQRYLGGHDVRVVGATDGEQALRLATELRPQAITLDVMMPTQDGWEILQRLKNTPVVRRIPVIVCSVLHEPELALSMGASDYITKPVQQVELLEVLFRWMGPLRPLS